jgi:hypothetical protein
MEGVSSTMIYGKNICKCHNAPPCSTTIKKKRVWVLCVCVCVHMYLHTLIYVFMYVHLYGTNYIVLCWTKWIVSWIQISGKIFSLFPKTKTYTMQALYICGIKNHLPPKITCKTLSAFQREVDIKTTICWHLEIQDWTESCLQINEPDIIQHCQNIDFILSYLLLALSSKLGENKIFSLALSFVIITLVAVYYGKRTSCHLPRLFYFRTWKFVIETKIKCQMFPRQFLL